MLRLRLMLFALLSLLLTSAASAATVQRFTSSDNDNCNNVQFGDDDYMATAVEQLTVPAGAPLKIIASRNGGVKVRGTDTNAFQVHVCKYAHGDSQQQADATLSQVHASATGGVLQATGPSDDNEDHRWVVFFIVDAPRNASVDVTGHNGPISVRDLSGTVNVQAHNGPVDLKRLTGAATVTAHNGPVAYSGSGGSIKLEAENGPLAINLLGNSWNGAGLDARTNNGPVAVRLPAQYNSGVEIETSGHSPISCSAKGCESVATDYTNGGRTMNFGSGNPVVRIATHNGPVAISNEHADY